MKEFFGNIGAELKKIAWPTIKEMKAHSIQVFAFMVVLSLFFFGTDAAISAGMAAVSPDAPTFMPPISEEYDYDVEDVDYDVYYDYENGEEDEETVE